MLLSAKFSEYIKALYNCPLNESLIHTILNNLINTEIISMIPDTDNENHKKHNELVRGMIKKNIR